MAQGCGFSGHRLGWCVAGLVLNTAGGGCSGERPSFVPVGDAGGTTSADDAGWQSVADAASVVTQSGAASATTSGDAAAGSSSSSDDRTRQQPDSGTGTVQADSDSGISTESSWADNDAGSSSSTNTDAGGSGDSSALLGVGATCNDGDECDSGYCVDGVCCSSRCDEVCARCDEPSSIGSCVAAEDDSACEPVICVPDTACTQYSPPSGPGCSALGECSDMPCSVNNAQQGTECGSGLQCDGQGNCESVCEEGQTWCDECIDLNTDKSHCGDCDTACGSSAECVNGDCKSWGPVSKVVDAEIFFDVAMAPDGNVFVAYSETLDAGGMVVRRRQAGGSWVGALDFTGTDTRDPFYTKGRLGTDQDGNAYALWGSSGGFGFARYRVGSASWSAPSYITLSLDVPYLAVGPSGDAFTVYDDQIASAGTQAWLRRYSATASAWSAPQQLHAEGSSTACAGAVGADAGGDGLVVYSDDAEVYARWWDAGSQAWRGAAKLLNEGYCFVSLAFDGAGRAVVASTGNDLHVAISDGANSWSSESLAPGTSYHAVAFEGKGGDALVAFEQGDDVRLAVWSATTETWQGTLSLFEGSSQQEYANVEMGLDGAGNGFAITVDVSGGRLVARRRDGASGEWGQQFTLGSAQPTGEIGYTPRLVVTPNGNAVAVWQERTDTTSTIWARVYE